MITHRWFPPEEWDRLQAVLPIVCVDLLPVRFGRRGTRTIVEAVGLILREVPHRGQRWCLIGGRVYRGESLDQAIRRHVRETLGASLKLLSPVRQPLYAAEYSPTGKRPFLLDTRRHSVALTYAITVHGVIKPAGEALEFEWYETKRLPSPQHFGFGQDHVVNACLKMLGTRELCST